MIAVKPNGTDKVKTFYRLERLCKFDLNEEDARKLKLRRKYIIFGA